TAPCLEPLNQAPTTVATSPPAPTELGSSLEEPRMATLHLISVREFTYDDMVNKSTSTSPFKIVTGYRPRNPTDLIPLPVHACVSESGESFAEHDRSIHDSIRRRLDVSNQQYKCMADA